MKEDFLHYVWKFQKFSLPKLTAVHGQNIRVICAGTHNHNSGPDFFNAQIRIDGQLWIGNVEIHVKASHWYVHRHERDLNYDNVILHVVWEHNAEIFRRDKTQVPVLEIRSIIPDELLFNYHHLFSKKNRWINCEMDLPKVDGLQIQIWLERLYIERLEQKTNWIDKEIMSLNNHWEALLFRMLCKNFGLKVNGDSFYSISHSMDFSTVKKCGQDSIDLEALLMGQAGLLDLKKDSHYLASLQGRYLFLKGKFGLKNKTVISPKFFRLRPANFPTIRLSQLAELFSKKKGFFSEVINAQTPEALYSILKVVANPYWDTHYNFGVASVKRPKGLTKKFLDLLIINTIIPLKFSYAKFQGLDNSEVLITLASAITKEENSIVNKFNAIIRVAENSMHSQALLQLKNDYCDKNRCLNCAVGNSILKNNAAYDK